MEIFDYVCCGLCALHIFCYVFEFVRGLKLNKRIDKLCDNCGLPVYSEAEHQCLDILKILSPGELSVLTKFVSFLNGGFDGK